MLTGLAAAIAYCSAISLADISHHQVLPGSVIAAVSGAGAVLLLIVGVIIAFFLDRSVS